MPARGEGGKSSLMFFGYACKRIVKIPVCAGIFYGPQLRGTKCENRQVGECSATALASLIGGHIHNKVF